MKLEGAWLAGAIVLFFIAIFSWVLLFVWVSRCAVPKKSTPKTMLIGAVGHGAAMLNLSFFLLCGVPYRTDVPTVSKVLYFLSLHVFLFWLAFNFQRRTYFLKVSPGHNKLGWQRNSIILLLFLILSAIMYLIHPLPWFENKNPTFQWYPLCVQIYFVTCNCAMLWYIWVVLRAQKFDVWCKKKVIGHVERQGECWVETMNQEVDGGLPKVVVLCEEKKVPLD